MASLTAPEINVVNADLTQPNDTLKVHTITPATSVPVAPFIDPTGRLGIGAYTINGEIFVHADSADMGLLHGHEVKSLCFRHRLAMGLSQAGLEMPVGPYVLSVDEARQVPPVVSAPANSPTYRIVFKLNP